MNNGDVTFEEAVLELDNRWCCRSRSFQQVFGGLAQVHAERPGQGCQEGYCVVEVPHEDGQEQDVKDLVAQVRHHIEEVVEDAAADRVNAHLRVQHGHLAVPLRRSPLALCCQVAHCDKVDAEERLDARH